MKANAILEYLKRYGQADDAELAKAVGISVDKVRLDLALLSMQGNNIKKSLMRAEDGRMNNYFMYRLA